jgi:ABC-2 type transport system permease protein
MNALVHAELLKLRTTRSLWVALAVVVALSAALPVIIALNPDGVELPDLTPSGLAEMVHAPANLAGGAVLLVGLLSSAGEFRHHTVLTTRLAEPRQLRVLTAKMMAVGIAGLGVGLVAVIVAGAGGAAALAVNDVAVEPLAHEVPRVFATVPVLLALHGLAGVAIGTAIRSTAGAVGATFLWVFVIEGVIPVVIRRPEFSHWLPGGAVQDVLRLDTVSGGLPVGAAAALLVGFIAVLVGAAAVLDARRDA